MSLTMKICPKCGSFKINTNCSYCNLERIDTETTQDEIMNMSVKEKKELINHYIETLIKDTYDPEIAKLSEESWQKRNETLNASISSGSCCPYCQSKFISKVTFFDRLLDTSLWGLASDIIGKTHKCDSCGAAW